MYTMFSSLTISAGLEILLVELSILSVPKYQADVLNDKGTFDIHDYTYNTRLLIAKDLILGIWSTHLID